MREFRTFYLIWHICYLRHFPFDNIFFQMIFKRVGCKDINTFIAQTKPISI